MWGLICSLSPWSLESNADHRPGYLKVTARCVQKGLLKKYQRKVYHNQKNTDLPICYILPAIPKYLGLPSVVIAIAIEAEIYTKTEVPNENFRCDIDIRPKKISSYSFSSCGAKVLMRQPRVSANIFLVSR